jgi:3-hydroxybutyryl-CoA dehydratase
MTEPIDTAHAGAKLDSCTVLITQELIDVYASISGDFNPIHVDTEAARASEFGGTIAHGCIPLEPVFQAVRSECQIAGVQQF